jgi:hypothetical protein
MPTTLDFDMLLNVELIMKYIVLLMETENSARRS